MKRPKSIRVGPFDVSVAQMPPGEPEADYGDYEDSKLRIQMAATFASPAQEAETFIHEILHAIWTTYNVKDEDKEERTVATLAIGLAQVLRDNKDLAEWLRDALK
jgi:hypothetical protein